MQDIKMNVEYCRQFSLLAWNSFIGQFVHTLGGRGLGKGGGGGGESIF